MQFDDQELVQNIILTAFIVPVILAVALIGFLIFYQRKTYQRQLEKKDLLLREQRLLIDKQQAIEQERNRIAGEMHDDLGSGLTTIRYLSDRAMRQARTDEEKSQIRKIAEQSNSLLRNMSEIIWALNLRYDNLGNLMAYLRRYAHEYLEEHGMPLLWEQQAFPDHIKISGEKRRNILLTVKEVLHNLVKHAHASQAIIHCTFKDQNVCISISDNGDGFDVKQVSDKGNGLYNLRKRMEMLQGTVNIQSSGSGSMITLCFPVEADLV